MHDLEKFEPANIKAFLQQTLRHKNTLIASEFGKVVADATRFVQAVIRDGFDIALADLTTNVQVQPDRPFIEVAEALVDHHIRFAKRADQELARKSLLEAYTYIAGPRHLFEPTKKTRFVQSLRRSDLKKFAGMLISLHLYNVIRVQIEDELRKNLSDVKTLELYLLSVEALCRDLILDSIKIQPGELDERWVMAVIRSVERQLIDSSSSSAESLHIPVQTRFRK